MKVHYIETDRNSAKISTCLFYIYCRELNRLAFESIPGIKVISRSAEQTYIFGDYFSVYTKGDSFPRIYNWHEISSVQETRADIIITAGETAYKISKSFIPDNKKLLAVRAVIEGAIAVNPAISYTYLKRILPAKMYYKNCDTPQNAYTATGVYNEKEISYSNVILLNARLGKTFIIISILIIVISFIFCHFFIGDTMKNWTYFVPISVFSGVIAAMFIYLVCAIIAKYIYASLLKIDPALTQPITFVVCSEGFAAVESCIYNGTDLIKWEEAAYFIETNYVYIIFKNKKAVFWLPKRLFKKEEQAGLSNFITHKLQQK